MAARRTKNARTATSKKGGAKRPRPAAGRKTASKKGPKAALKKGQKKGPAAPRPARNPRLALLAFSGGLDTSVILRWLQETYDCEVATYTADLGHGGEAEEARAKALALGVRPRHAVVEDLRGVFAADYVFPMLRAAARYEDAYLLGTAIARPLIARRMVEAAQRLGADALSHGCTGKGNDQLRFEMTFAALAPELRVLAPWREWELAGRSDLLSWAAARGIPVAKRKGGAPSYSTDANLLHVSYEGGELEDPWAPVPEEAWTMTRNPATAPAAGAVVRMRFAAGDAVSLDGKRLAPAALLDQLNRIAGRHGVGRLDMVESRATGMKSRGAYETPGGTALLAARRGLEQITLDREVMRLRDELAPRYAAMVYGGLWDSPERRVLQALVDQAARTVEGEVRLRLQRGVAWAEGRRSPVSLYRKAQASFEGEEGGEGARSYDQADAGGFIRLQSLRLAASAEQEERLALPKRTKSAPRTAPRPAPRKAAAGDRRAKKARKRV